MLIRLMGSLPSSENISNNYHSLINVQVITNCMAQSYFLTVSQPVKKLPPFNPFMLEVILNNSVRTSRITTFLKYKNQWVHAVYSWNHIKPINSLCGQNAELVNSKAGGTYSKHCASKGSRTRRFINIFTWTHHCGPNPEADEFSPHPHTLVLQYPF
jgi:hypothetical protein